jgi:hypothetical protein
MKLVKTSKHRGPVHFISRLGPSPSELPYNSCVDPRGTCKISHYETSPKYPIAAMDGQPVLSVSYSLTIPSHPLFLTSHKSMCLVNAGNPVGALRSKI